MGLPCFRFASRMPIFASDCLRSEFKLSICLDTIITKFRNTCLTSLSPYVKSTKNSSTFSKLLSPTCYVFFKFSIFSPILLASLLLSYKLFVGILPKSFPFTYESSVWPIFLSTGKWEYVTDWLPPLISNLRCEVDLPWLLCEVFLGIDLNEFCEFIMSSSSTLCYRWDLLYFHKRLFELDWFDYLDFKDIWSFSAGLFK